MKLNNFQFLLKGCVNSHSKKINQLIMGRARVSISAPRVVSWPALQAASSSHSGRCVCTGHSASNVGSKAAPRTVRLVMSVSDFVINKDV